VNELPSTGLNSHVTPFSRDVEREVVDQLGELPVTRFHLALPLPAHSLLGGISLGQFLDTSCFGLVVLGCSAR
jgi:hypothetical protein